MSCKLLVHRAIKVIQKIQRTGQLVLILAAAVPLKVLFGSDYFKF
jgi:hypothetical protein